MPRGKVNPDQLALDTQSPVFVTWKKYGFRHIVGLEKTETIKGFYSKKDAKLISGKALCGNTYWYTEGDPAPWEKPHDSRASERPLCGHCAKIWKQRTGQLVT